MKRLIFVLLCAVCLVSCSDTSVSEESSSSEEVSVIEIVADTTTTVSASTTVTGQTTTQTTAPIVTYPRDIDYIPENAIYKKTKYRMNDNEKQITEISFFDEHDNIVCNVNPNLNDNIYSIMRYVYKYNDDNTISSKKLIAENGITSVNNYEYNDDGTLRSISYLSEGRDLARTEYYEFNENGDILTKNIFMPNESEPYRTEIHEYEYDENGKISHDIITKTDMGYSVDYKEVETIDYTYDENGNILIEHSVRTGICHTLATDTDEDDMIVYTYNSSNQCISAEITDKYGNISIIEYEYYK